MLQWIVKLNPNEEFSLFEELSSLAKSNYYISDINSSDIIYIVTDEIVDDDSLGISSGAK